MRRTRLTKANYSRVELRWQTTYAWALGQSMDILEAIESGRQKFINVFNDFEELMFSTGVSNTDKDAVRCAIDKKKDESK